MMSISTNHFAHDAAPLRHCHRTLPTEMPSSVAPMETHRENRIVRHNNPSCLAVGAAFRKISVPSGAKNWMTDCSTSAATGPKTMIRNSADTILRTGNPFEKVAASYNKY